MFTFLFTLTLIQSFKRPTPKSILKKTVSFSLSFTAFPILDLPCTAEDAKANVTVLDLKAVYEKGQSRRKANSEQRLLNADVNLTATSQKQIQVDIQKNRAKEKQQENGKPHSLALFSWRAQGLL